MRLTLSRAGSQHGLERTPDSGRPLRLLRLSAVGAVGVVLAGIGGTAAGVTLLSQSDAPAARPTNGLPVGGVTNERPDSSGTTGLGSSSSSQHDAGSNGS